MTSLNLSHFANIIKNSKRFDKIIRNVVIKSIKDGQCLAEMKVEEEHTNPMGGLHGGLSATLVDTLSSYALLTHKHGAVPSVSVDMHMTYLRGAKLGDEIVIDCRTDKVGKSLAFLEVFITNKETGDLLVKGSHTKYLLQEK